MKTTLTSDDPSGWYLCEFRGRTYARWWDGENFRRDPGGMQYGTPYAKIRRVITEHDVAALRQALAENEALVEESVKGAEQVNEELRTLRDELGKQKEKWRILDRDYGIRINERNSLQGKLEVCEKYAASFQKQCDDYLGELRKAREENATLQSQVDSLLKQAEQLEAELSRLKSHPYEMRRADRPDCEGIWLRIDEDRRHVRCVVTLACEFSPGPWYYLGPLPVLPVEQQPPKVVTIKCKETGKESRAIPSFRGGSSEYYFLILDDGTMSGERVWCNNWKEVQP